VYDTSVSVIQGRRTGARGHGQDLRDEGEGHLVYLGNSLEDADGKPHDRERRSIGAETRSVVVSADRCRGPSPASFVSPPRSHAKLRTSVLTRRAHPSTRTNSISLNGRDHYRRQHHHSHRQENGRHDHVQDQKRDVDHEPDLKSRLQLAHDEGGDDDADRKIGLRRRDGNVPPSPRTGEGLSPASALSMNSLSGPAAAVRACSWLISFSNTAGGPSGSPSPTPAP
jgi:hypothetical protein